MAPNPLALLTPAQRAAQINTQTSAAITPERLAIQAAQRAAQKDAIAQQQRIVGFARAAADQLQQSIPQTSAAYHQALTDQQGLAGGFSDAMRAALANVPGAPATSPDATYALGAVIPGSRLNADAVASLGAAQAQPAAQLALGQTGLRSSAYNAQLANQKYMDAQQQLAAKVPGIRQQFANQVNQQEQQKIALGASLDKLGFDKSKFAYQQQKDYANMYGYGPNGQPTLAQKRLDQATAKAKIAGKAVDQSKSKDTGTIWLKNGKKWINPDTGKPQKIAKQGSGGTYAERHPLITLKSDASAEAHRLIGEAKFSKSSGKAVSTGDPTLDAALASINSSKTSGPPDVAEIVASVLQSTSAISTGMKAGISPGRTKAIVRKIVFDQLRALGYNVGKKK